MTGPADDVRRAVERLQGRMGEHQPDRHALLSADGRRIVGDCCCRAREAHPLPREARWRVVWEETCEAQYWDDPTRTVRFGDTLRTVRGELPISLAPAYRLVPITDREERQMTTNDDGPTTLEATPEPITVTVPGAARTIKDQPVPAGVIRIDPDHGWPEDRRPIEAVGDQHQAAAESIYRVLYECCAQGTLERLLALLLIERAGYRIVRARAVPVDALVLEGVADAGVRELAEAEQALADHARTTARAAAFGPGPRVFGLTLTEHGALEGPEREAMAERVDALLSGPVLPTGEHALAFTTLAILRRQR